MPREPDADGSNPIRCWTANQQHLASAEHALRLISKHCVARGSLAERERVFTVELLPCSSSSILSLSHTKVATF